MAIIKIGKDDIMKVVKVHKDSFKGFFLTELGDGFLNVYYNSVRKDNNGIMLGFFQDGQLLGFCAATTVAKGFNAQLVKKNLLQFSLITLRLMWTRTAALIRLLKNFSKSDSTSKDDGDYAELLSIGVSSISQGQGIGKQLLLELEKEMKLKNVSKLSLTTDYDNNQRAIIFYKALGYEIYYDFTAYPNRKMYRMIKSLI
jgi:ribosomal protein S18 acetylase RimI-like enzyme